MINKFASRVPGKENKRELLPSSREPLGEDTPLTLSPELTVCPRCGGPAGSGGGSGVLGCGGALVERHDGQGSCHHVTLARGTLQSGTKFYSSDKILQAPEKASGERNFP